MINVAVLVHEDLKSDRLFDLAGARDCSLERFVQLREILDGAQINCRTYDRFAFSDINVVIFHDLNSEYNILNDILRVVPHVRLLYMPNEPAFISPLHATQSLLKMPFDRILSWNDEAVDRSDRVIKCNIGQPLIVVDNIPSIPVSQKSFMGCIYSNKSSRDKNGLYSERIRAVEFFAMKNEGVDLFGVGWKKSDNALIKQVYRGKCERKIDVLKQYKFSVCFENVKGCPGLITEKIFDCFAAGTVPIYYGAPNIQDYISPECFIDFRDFSDYDSLYTFMQAMTELEYQTYLDAVKVFIDSPAYQAFTSKGFAEIVLSQIQALNDEPLPNRSVWKFKFDVIRAALHCPPRSVKNFLRYVRFLFKFTFAR